MRIQNNIAALNSHRQLGANNTAVGKNLEKLSSGFRINRAGDDAAGLAISEKMRAQIKGLETASKNANDGISLVQTAEGALTEVHSMLNRMSELATQSANGTYDNDTDRANLQKEVSSLTSEIDRISEGTNFNGINLLDGSLNNGSTVSLNFGATAIEASAGKDFAGTVQIAAAAANAEGITVAIADDGSTLAISLGAQTAASYSASQINQAVKDAVATKLAGGTVADADKAKVSALSSFEASFTGSLSIEATSTLDTTAKAVTPDPTKAGLTLQIGDTADNFNQLTVKVGAMDSNSLGIGAVDISNQTGAQDAVAKIKAAINQVSSTRGDLGAAQNRLEHTINNLGVTAENMTAAESRIRDVDMAKEMMNFTKNNILTQASQAMLAQANQLPQGVLQLLQ
ncbi:flagellin N-terminal helical domain-containing protein [Anaerotignum sp. MB30-C6]|uniref:flagellin N-terminal helical domain-containing protein n=1 Tax=Anaerotignum sp. MB30-C6 TaxID=3070814 RepID=UPI0027DC5384|nr:flagellin [Anaerotignum sp. MB30-C6]WMI79830.1 flagellin [Anaerotignum sp. MB30-C6]